MRKNCAIEMDVLVLSGLLSGTASLRVANTGYKPSVLRRYIRWCMSIKLWKIGLVLSIVVVAACDETTSSSYRNYTEVIGSLKQPIEKGRLPKWLPKSAINIEEVSDVTTGQVWVSLYFDSKDLFYSDCVSFERGDVLTPKVSRPVAFTYLATDKNWKFFSCKGDRQQFNVAVNDARNLALLWAVL
jgi:hypothetical protein